MKKIGIIGANSYIARNLIHMIDTLSDQYELKLYDVLSDHKDNHKDYTQINILNQVEVEAIDSDCDVLYMFTGKTGTFDGFTDPGSFLDINERALLNLLTVWSRNGVKTKLVFPSTRLVYKGSREKLSEHAEKEFKTIYAMNKYACEQYLEMYHQIFGTNFCVFRICVPYGTLIESASSYGTAEFMLNKARKGEEIQLYGGGHVRRTFTHIEDLCALLLKGGLSATCTNDVYNIGGADYSLKEIAEIIAEKYGIQVKSVPWPEKALKIESGDTVFDFRKLNSALGKHEYRRIESWMENPQK